MIKKYDTTVLQSKTAINLMNVIGNLVSIAKTNTNLAKSIIRDANNALELHQKALERIDARTTTRMIDEKNEFEEWLDKTYPE